MLCASPTNSHQRYHFLRSDLVLHLVFSFRCSSTKRSSSVSLSVSELEGGTRTEVGGAATMEGGAAMEKGREEAEEDVGAVGAGKDEGGAGTGTESSGAESGSCTKSRYQSSPLSCFSALSTSS